VTPPTDPTPPSAASAVTASPDLVIAEHRIGAFLGDLAAKQPVPGGGAVASLVAGLGAALGQMVVNYSVGKKSLTEHDALHHEALTALESLHRRALELAEEDAAAYGALNELWKLGKDDERRSREMPAAVRRAIDAPRQVIEAGQEALDWCDRLAGCSNAMLASDLAIAAVLGEAAVRSAAWNVRITLPMLDDAELAGRYEREIAEAVGRAAETCVRVEGACQSG